MTASLDAPGANPGVSHDFGPATRWSVAPAAQRSPLGDSYACMECFGPLEIGYDFGTVTHADIETGPTVDVAVRTAASCSSRRRHAPQPRAWYDQVDPSGQPGSRTRDEDAVRQGRQRQPHPLVQGPRRGRRSCLRVSNSASPRLVAPRPATSPTQSRLRAARAGLRSCVFVPSNLEAGKIVTTAVYDGTLVAVEGNYDDVNRLCSEVAGDLGWGFVNVNLRPYYAEGRRPLVTRSPSNSAGVCRGRW